jgi:hypothetical protein
VDLGIDELRWLGNIFADFFGFGDMALLSKVVKGAAIERKI